MPGPSPAYLRIRSPKTAGHEGPPWVAKRPTAAEPESKALARCDSTAHRSPPGPEPVDRTGTPTHPIAVMRDIGAQNKNIGARKLSDAHQ